MFVCLYILKFLLHSLSFCNRSVSDVALPPERGWELGFQPGPQERAVRPALRPASPPALRVTPARGAAPPHGQARRCGGRRWLRGGCRPASGSPHAHFLGTGFSGASCPVGGGEPCPPGATAPALFIEDSGVTPTADSCCFPHRGGAQRATLLEPHCVWGTQAVDLILEML